MEGQLTGPSIQLDGWVGKAPNFLAQCFTAENGLSVYHRKEIH
jgi:hypothetical protein